VTGCGVYLVTDTALCGGPTAVIETVRAAVAAGVNAVQLRDPHATTRELAALASALRDALEGSGVPLIINDRVDVALAVGAAGAHVGQSDLDPVSARRLLGPGLHLGLSVSNLDEVAAANALPAGTVDLLGIGPVRDTPSKTNAATALDWAGVRDLTAATTLPCVAIGGISSTDCPSAWSAGCVGVAVISAICGRADPGSAARQLVANWQLAARP
jgi:thiamine-phosphate pyrophosphorylase